MRRFGPSAAFTLIDLLFVILVIALLMTILLPVVNRVRRAGYLAVCASNLHHVGTAFHAYAADNLYEIPVAYGGDAGEKAQPTAFFRVLVDDKSQGVKLLVTSPIGTSKQPYLSDARLFVCPGDYSIVRKSSSDFGYGQNWEDTPEDLRAMSYAYWYVPPSGDFYRYWTTTSQTQHEWFSALFKGLARHTIRQANTPTTAILIERPVASRWIGESFHQGDGGNVLYLDGHVTWVNRMPIELLPRPIRTGPFAQDGDGSTFVNYVDHAGQL